MIHIQSFKKNGKQSRYFEITPTTAVNKMQDNKILYRVININHMYISIYVDF